MRFILVRGLTSWLDNKCGKPRKTVLHLKMPAYSISDSISYRMNGIEDNACTKSPRK